MNLSLSLHTAARRYCYEQHAHWATVYAKMSKNGQDRSGYSYTPKALATFPRYNVLNAIRVEIERIDSEHLGTIDETHKQLLKISQLANDEFTQNPIDETVEAVMEEEREKFYEYVDGLPEAELSRIDPMPYQRVLSPDEAETIRSQVRQKWAITDDYWFPLSDRTINGIEAFQAFHFADEVEPEWIQRLLLKREIARVWELRESGPEYEQDTELLAPHYNLAEGYWTSADLDWIIYASHESSITVGGWMLDDVKAIWKKWPQRIWTTPFYV